MNGLGNDFVVLDARRRAIAVDAKRAQILADRQTGIGCDQVILLEPSSRAAVFMRILNADGSEVAACGNATRCVARILAEEGGLRMVRIETKAGLLEARIGEGGVVTVDMGRPRLRWDEIPLAEPFHDTRRIELQVGPSDAPILHSPSVVGMGNPHCIFWVEDVSGYDLARIGPMLEHHPMFPERANISLAHVVSRGEIRLRVWERGAGLTTACGTAACAVAVAAARLDLTDRRVTVVLPGGPLDIEWTLEDRVLMTGATTMEFEGLLDPETFQRLAIHGA